MLMLNYACDGGGCASRKPCPVCGKEPTATPIENSFYSYAELTEEQKIRFAAYQVFDVPKKASSKLEAAQRWIPVSEGLPEIGVRVLFYNNFIKNIHKGWYSGDEWISEIGVFYDGDKLKRITHWMPLPKFPEVPNV